MSSLFVILDKNSGAFVTNQRRMEFSNCLNDASLFVSRENATKAMYKMNRNFDERGEWRIGTKLYHHGDLAGDIKYWQELGTMGAQYTATRLASATKAYTDLEVREVTLQLVG